MDRLYQQGRYGPGTVWNNNGGDQKDNRENRWERYQDSSEDSGGENNNSDNRRRPWVRAKELEEDARICEYEQFDLAELTPATMERCVDLIEYKVEQSNRRLAELERLEAQNDETATIVDIKSREWKGQINALNAAIEMSKDIQSPKK